MEAVGLHASIKSAAVDTGCLKMAKPKRKAKRRAAGGLTKWFAEDWRDISTKDKSGKHPKCGRKSTKGSKRGYPKCVTAAKSRAMSANQKKQAVARKRASKPASGGKRPTYTRT